MSPVDQSRNHVGRAATVAVVGVVVTGLVLGLATLALNHTPSTQLHLGDQTFHAGNAANIAADIARDGPVAYGDVSGRKDRPIILQHLGSNPKTRWYAFLAFPDDKDANCAWEWQKTKHLFRAKCDHHRTAPADGKGLTQYPVTVTGGNLDIDLNAEARKQATTKSSTTTSPAASTTPATTVAS